jgi:uncharacterized membrane protein YecN with MAPEG domain
MAWTGWTISGAAIALGVLVLAGLAIAVVRGLMLKRRIARAEGGAAELSREIERLRVPVAELQVISRYAWLAIVEIKGPLGWIAGIRALIRSRGR